MKESAVTEKMEKLMVGAKSKGMAKMMGAMSMKARKGTKLANSRQSALAQAFGKE